MPSIPGLPGDDGHAGWAITASHGLLQLWECSRSGGRGEPALMMVHSQGIDHCPAHLAAEPGMQLLLAACQTNDGKEWVTAHSLDVSALLSQKCKAPMPHLAAAQLPGRHCFSVVSLHQFGGTFSRTCAASYGGGVAVWDIGTKRQFDDLTTPRMVWKAHDALITAMHASTHGQPLLFTGAADGSVRSWDLRTKPTTPTAVFHHGGGRMAASGIHQLNDQTLVSAGGNGRLLLWDVRSTQHPVGAAAMPDGTGATHLAVNTVGDLAAVATRASGVYAIDLLDGSCQMSTVSVPGMIPEVTAMQWNANNEVLAGGNDGCIRVFRDRRYLMYR
jgi:WD40 repeat protein